MMERPKEHILYIDTYIYACDELSKYLRIEETAMAYPS